MTYSAEVLADSPVGYWRLDEASGSFADSSGNGYTGTLTGTPTYAQPAAAALDGTSVTLDGSTFATATPVLLNSQTAFTLEAWVKTTSASGILGVMGCRDTALNHQQFQFRFNTGKPEVIFFSSGSTAHTVTGPSSLADGTWRHFAATCSATAILVYINGAQVASGAGTTVQSLSGLALLLGRAWTADPAWFGSLDELAVYSSALSAARVAVHYSAGAIARNRPLVLTAAAVQRAATR